MSKALLVITTLFVEHQTPAEVATRYGVHSDSVRTGGRPDSVQTFGGLRPLRLQ